VTEETKPAAVPKTAKALILSEMARELSMRRRLFPDWVKAGKLKQEDADSRISRLQDGYDFIVHNMPDEYLPRRYG
jgi:hypothetical protein